MKLNKDQKLAIANFKKDWAEGNFSEDHGQDCEKQNVIYVNLAGFVNTTYSSDNKYKGDDYNKQMWYNYDLDLYIYVSKTSDLRFGELKIVKILG